MLETDNILPGSMLSSNSDFSIIRVLDVLTMPRAPSIMVVPSPGWIRVNTGGSALGAPEAAGSGGVFITFAGYPRDAFGFSIGQEFAYMVELCAAIYALEVAWWKG